MNDAEQYELASYIFKAGSVFLFLAGIATNSAIVFALSYFVCTLSWWLRHFQVESMRSEQ